MHTRLIQRCGVAGYYLVILLLAGALVGWASEPPEQKVAEGQHSFRISGEGAEESWVLFRDGEGYRAESRLQFKPSAGSVEIATRFWLDPDLSLVRWESAAEGKDRKWGCALAKEEVRCWDDGDEGRLAISGPYLFHPMVPPSVWFLVGVLQPHRFQSTAKRVRVVFWDVADGPTDLTASSELEIVYFGQESFRLGNKDFNSYKFLLTPTVEEAAEALGPGATVLVTAEGVPLTGWARNESGEKEELGTLIRYEKYAEFGPGVE